MIQGVVTPKQPHIEPTHKVLTLNRPDETCGTISLNRFVTLVGVGAGTFWVAASTMSVLAFTGDPMAAYVSPPASTIQCKTIPHMLLLANIVKHAWLLGVWGKLAIVGGLDGSRSGVIPSSDARVPPERTKKHCLIGLRLLYDCIQVLFVIAVVPDTSMGYVQFHIRYRYG